MKLVVKIVEVNGSGQDTREHILLSPSPAANHMLQVQIPHASIHLAPAHTMSTVAFGPANSLLQTVHPIFLPHYIALGIPMRGC